MWGCIPHFHDLGNQLRHSAKNQFLDLSFLCNRDIQSLLMNISGALCGCRPFCIRLKL